MALKLAPAPTPKPTPKPKHAAEPKQPEAGTVPKNAPELGHKGRSKFTR
jgi:hypothetical protein